jgi:pseudaminic acid cytidylyltransferase
MNVAIIPARGGSKRIPKKNIKNFLGKPIIAYSIEAAVNSNLFDKVIVSTDSSEIADIAVKYGAEVPFIRSKKLSNDLTPTAPVLENAVNLLESFGYKIEYFCCIYPTAPFVRAEYLRKGYNFLRDKGCSAVFSITTFDFTIYRAVRLSDDGKVRMVYPKYKTTRSQDLTEAYHDAGQFYWFDKERFMKKPTLLPDDCYPIILPRNLTQDIDTMEDWHIAESMYKAQALL